MLCQSCDNQSFVNPATKGANNKKVLGGERCFRNVNIVNNVLGSWRDGRNCEDGAKILDSFFYLDTSIFSEDLQVIVREIIK